MPYRDTQAKAITPERKIKKMKNIIDVDAASKIAPVRIGTTDGATVWAVRHCSGWGWVSDCYSDPFSSPKTGGAALAAVPSGEYATADEAGAAGLAAVRAYRNET